MALIPQRLLDTISLFQVRLQCGQVLKEYIPFSQNRSNIFGKGLIDGNLYFKFNDLVNSWTNLDVDAYLAFVDASQYQKFESIKNLLYLMFLSLRDQPNIGPAEKGRDTIGPKWENSTRFNTSIDYLDALSTMTDDYINAVNDVLTTLGNYKPNEV